MSVFKYLASLEVSEFSPTVKDCTLIGKCMHIAHHAEFSGGHAKVRVIPIISFFCLAICYLRGVWGLASM